jgi:hypothetical protein
MITLGKAYDATGIAIGQGGALAFASLTLHFGLWRLRRKRMSEASSKTA